MRDTVQWMAGGRLGAVGVPAPYPVEEVPGREQGTVLTQCHSMEETNVKGLVSRVTFAIVTLVQPMVTGALGAAGGRAVGHAMEGR